MRNVQGQHMERERYIWTDRNSPKEGGGIGTCSKSIARGNFRVREGGSFARSGCSVAASPQAKFEAELKRCLEKSRHP